MNTQTFLFMAVTGGCATLVLSAYFWAFYLQKTSKSKPEPFRCPTCGGESFEEERSGHAEFEDHSDGWYWYATCQSCQGHCASMNGRPYVPTAREWEEWVSRPREEEALRQVAEEKLKEHEYRKYKWCFDKEWPFDTENQSSAETE